jgi:hypothetical protein
VAVRRKEIIERMEGRGEEKRISNSKKFFSYDIEISKIGNPRNKGGFP